MERGGLGRRPCPQMDAQAVDPSNHLLDVHLRTKVLWVSKQFTLLSKRISKGYFVGTLSFLGIRGAQEKLRNFHGYLMFMSFIGK